MSLSHGRIPVAITDPVIIERFEYAWVNAQRVLATPIEVADASMVSNWHAVLQYCHTASALWYSEDDCSPSPEALADIQTIATIGWAITRVLPPPSDLRASWVRYGIALALGHLADTPKAVRSWALEHPLTPLTDALPWNLRLLGTLAHVWTDHWVQPEGAHLAPLQHLRRIQMIYEPSYLFTQSTADAAHAASLELLGLYHWVRASDMLRPGWQLADPAIVREHFHHAICAFEMMSVSDCLDWLFWLQFAVFYKRGHGFV